MLSSEGPRTKSTTSVEAYPDAYRERKECIRREDLSDPASGSWSEPRGSVFSASCCRSRSSQVGDDCASLGALWQIAKLDAASWVGSPCRSKRGSSQFGKRPGGLGESFQSDMGVSVREGCAFVADQRHDHGVGDAGVLEQRYRGVPKAVENSVRSLSV